MNDTRDTSAGMLREMRKAAEPVAAEFRDSMFRPRAASPADRLPPRVRAEY